MAWKEKDLVTDWITPVRISNGNDITLGLIQSSIEEECAKNGIPVAFKEEMIKVGIVFSSQMETVLQMYHPQKENEYLRFVIRLKQMGTNAFVNVYNMGGSKNYRMVNKADADSKIAKIRMNLFGGKAALEQEEQYYYILKECLKKALGD